MNNLYLDYVYESYRDFMLNNTFLNQTVKKHTIHLVLGILSLSNNTYFINQDYAIFCVYSTLEISNLFLDQIQSSENIILVSESIFNIDSLQVSS